MSIFLIIVAAVQLAYQGDQITKDTAKALKWARHHIAQPVAHTAKKAVGK